MDRREFLATGATLAIAAAGGCTGCAQMPTASLRMDAISDAEIAEKVTHDLESEDSLRYQLVSDAVENESETVEDTEPPFPANRSFVYDGSVHRLSHEVVESKPATVFRFTLNPADETVTDDESIRYENLPAVDRKNLDYDGSFLGFGSSMLYLDSEISESVLVPDPQYSVIVWGEDDRGRFEVDGSHSTELKTYRYESEQVHPSAEQFGEQVRQKYEFTLSGLSDAEREIVREAIDSEQGYTVPPDESLPDSVWRLAKRFRTHEEVRRAWEDGAENEAGESVDGGDTETTPAPSIPGTYLVRYEGEVYWANVYVTREMTTATTVGG